MMEIRTELGEDDRRSLLNLFSNQRNPSSFQHPDWPVQVSETQRLVHFILSKNNSVVAYAKVTESRFSRLSFLKYATLVGTPLVSNNEVLVDFLSQVSGHYSRLNFAEFTISLMTFDLQQAELIDRSLRKYGYRVSNGSEREHRSTLVLPVEGDLNSISVGYSTNLKRNIKKGVKVGIEVKEVQSYEEFEAFEEIYSKMKSFRGVDLHRTDFLQYLFKFVQSTGLGRFIAAYYKGKMIGGMLLIDHGDRSEYFIGGTDPELKSLPQAHLTFNSAIQTVQLKGLKYFDFGGFGFSATEESQVFNINRFKLSFTRQVMFYPKPIRIHTNHLLSRFGRIVYKLLPQ